MAWKMPSALKRIAVVADSISIAICAIFTAAYVVLISSEVFARYLFDASQSWTFELATYLFLISVFLGSATGFWERTHLSIVEHSNRTVVGRCFRLVIDLICLVICVVLVWFGYRYAVAGLGRISPSMGFKMVLVYAWVPATFALSTFFIVVRWYGDQE